MTDDPHHLSEQHYYGIGVIAVQWAALETIILFLLARLLSIDDGRAIITFWHMGYNDRRDRLCSLMDFASLPDDPKKEFDCLITRMNAGYKIRNTVAHSIWAKGAKPGEVIPHSIVARGKVKVSGINMAEEVFTPERFLAEADKISRVAQDMVMFASQHLGFDPTEYLEEP